MSIDFQFKFDYKPVGQGLFASGAIHRIHEDLPCFTWVYDCGSSDSPHCLTREIDRLTRELGDYSKIDVLILSHFDRDHINGVSELLRRFRVDRLIIPYLPIEDRLLIALSEPVAGFDFLQTLMNPARQFIDIGRENLGEVIYITGGGHEEPPPSPGENFDLPPEGPLDRYVKFFLIKDEFNLQGEAGIQNGDRISYASDQSTLSIPGLWELVFFNKESKRATDEFISKIHYLVGSWDWGNRTGRNPQDFINRLKKLYEEKFPSGKPRNNISLVTYSGPLYSTWDHVVSCTGAVYLPNNLFKHNCFCYGYLNCHGMEKNKCSHLFFGDITIRKKLLVSEIIPHFGNDRWKRVQTIQVPHHGANQSWYRGAANEFVSSTSIFSYGLNNAYRHPGKNTLDDLKFRGPVFVNEIQGASTCGILIRQSKDSDS